MKSIWSEEVEIEKRKHLSSGGQIEAVVIGAGMAGILTASLLQERDIEVIVLEANRIASGQTCHTTAKITSQAVCVILRRIKRPKNGTFRLS